MAKNSKEWFHKTILLFLYLAGFSAVIYLLFTYWDYYFTPSSQRIRMDVHDLVKPSGLIGHGIGILGTLMMLLLLLYTIRKRFNFMSGAGKLSHWLNIHIFFGITGPLLVTLHTAFKFNGIVAVSFWSMVAVALSGFIGRYLYVQIPRNLAGKELTMQEINSLSEQMSSQLKNQYQCPDYLLKLVENLSDFSGKKSGLLSIPGLFFGDISLFFRFRNIRRSMLKSHDIPPQHVRMVIKTARQKIRLVRRIHLLSSVQKLFHYWHIIHKPFAIIMYLIMIVHVAVAVIFGYTWIF